MIEGRHRVLATTLAAVTLSFATAQSVEGQRTGVTKQISTNLAPKKIAPQSTSDFERAVTTARATYDEQKKHCPVLGAAPPRYNLDFSPDTEAGFRHNTLYVNTREQPDVIANQVTDLVDRWCVTVSGSNLLPNRVSVDYVFRNQTAEEVVNDELYNPAHPTLNEPLKIKLNPDPIDLLQWTNQISRVMYEANPSIRGGQPVVKVIDDDTCRPTKYNYPTDDIGGFPVLGTDTQTPLVCIASNYFTDPSSIFYELGEVVVHEQRHLSQLSALYDRGFALKLPFSYTDSLSQRIYERLIKFPGMNWLEADAGVTQRLFANLFSQYCAPGEYNTCTVKYNDRTITFGVIKSPNDYRPLPFYRLPKYPQQNIT